MTGNIIGEEVDEFVGKQIKTRQSIAGKGYDSSDPRTQGSQIYQNGRNAWVKLASGVGIIGDGIITTQDKDGNNFTDPKKIESGEQRLIDLGLGANYSGIELAKEAVLFNGLSKLNPSTLKMKDGEYEIDESTQSPIVDQPGSYQFRQGVSKKRGFWNSGKAYGFGGAEFGLQPMPGIESAEIQCLNRGSIKKATVTIKAFNKFQLDVIELLYLRLGYIMMLEWGWDKYYKDKNTLKKTMNTVIEDYWFDQGECTSLLKLYHFVNVYKEKYKANYDGFVGRVTNYQWSFNPDGSYDVVLEMYSVGDVIESLKANVPVGDKTGATFVTTDLSSTTQTNQQVYDRLIAENKINKFRDNEICFWLWNTIRTESFINYENKNLYRIPIYSTIGPTKPNTTRNPYPTLFAMSQKRTNQCPSVYRNFIRLGYFLDEFQERVIPYVAPCEKVSDPILRIDTDENTNLISLNDDQFSLDPRVCIHDMTNCFPEDHYWHAKQDPGRGLFIKSEFSVLGGSDSDRTAENFGYGGADSGALDPLEKFAIQSEANRRKHVVSGRLMNLYINYECIFQIFENNIDRNTGAISLFTFLTELCNEINGAFANTVNLEPIIDDGEIIKLVDLNPLAREKASLEKKNYINTYGYNQDNTSNFVRDLTLNTFIDSKLSSTLAIGAVREGNIPKNYEGAGLQYWNRGLKNRYLNDIIINEKKYETSPSQAIKDYKENLFKHWKDYSSLGTTIVNAVTNYNVVGNFGVGIYAPIRKTVHYNGKWYWNVYAFEFVEQAFSDDTVKHKKQITRRLNEKSVIKPSLDWRTYVAYSIGGLTSKGYENSSSTEIKNKMIPYRDSMYFACDPGYINLGKSLWKQLLSKRASAGAKLGYPPLSYSGFIPLSFDLTLEGISGIKIYNRLNLNQDFLPHQYKQGKFEYIIKQVNHNISNNDWTTQINSFSYPDLDVKTLKRYKDGDDLPEEITNDTLLTDIPEDPLDLLKKLIAKGESGGTEGNYKISNYLFKNNPDDRYNKVGLRENLDVTTLTIQQILDRGQNNDDITENQNFYRNSGAIYATGKYQMIPSTLRTAVRKTDGVKLSDLYTKEVQEKLFNYLIFDKRPRVGKYLKNTNSGSGEIASKLNLEIAIQQLSQEFASIPTIEKNGTAVGYVATGLGSQSFYGGSDSAKHTIKEVVIALIGSRKYYGSPDPEYIPDYAQIY